MGALKEIIIEDFKSGLTRKQIADKRGIKRGTVNTTIYRFVKATGFSQEESPDDEIVEENVRLKQQVQRGQDRNRIQNKAFRNHARINNVIETMHETLIDLLNTHKPETYIHEEVSLEHSKVGILQLSDLHLNELVDDVMTNKFDMDIASTRLNYFTSRAIEVFNSHEISHVVVAMTGDNLNSDRRISEITESATNRMNAAFIAIDMIKGVISHLNQDFNVSVCGVTGNESRTKDYIDWTKFLASDSYDVMIHNCLTEIFRDCPGVNFTPINDPIECVININGIGILMVHGHSHKNIARKSGNLSEAVRLLRDKYASMGVKIHYVIMGHIHEASISDIYARSASLVGDNAYSTRALGCLGRASQNLYIVDSRRKTIDGIKIDLQNVEKDWNIKYAYNEDLIAYNQTINKGSNIFIVNDTII